LCALKYLCTNYYHLNRENESLSSAWTIGTKIVNSCPHISWQSWTHFYLTALQLTFGWTKKLANAVVRYPLILKSLANLLWRCDFERCP
jgi:hypothetical protein